MTQFYCLLIGNYLKTVCNTIPDWTQASSYVSGTGSSGRKENTYCPKIEIKKVTFENKEHITDRN